MYKGHHAIFSCDVGISPACEKEKSVVGHGLPSDFKWKYGKRGIEHACRYCLALMSDNVIAEYRRSGQLN